MKARSLLTIIAAAAALTTQAASAQQAPPPPTAEKEYATWKPEIGIDSEFTGRGLGPQTGTSVQAGITLEYGPLSVTGWSNTPTVHKTPSELDVMSSYTLKREGAGALSPKLSVGHFLLYFPEGPGADAVRSQEINSTIAFPNLPLQPQVTVGYDWEAGSGHVVDTSLKWESQPLITRWGVVSDVTVGLDGNLHWNNGYFSPSRGEFTSSDIGVTINADTPLGAAGLSGALHKSLVDYQRDDGKPYFFEGATVRFTLKP